MFLFKNPSVWFAFFETESMWGIQERLSEIVTPRYLAEGTVIRFKQLFVNDSILLQVLSTMEYYSKQEHQNRTTCF